MKRILLFLAVLFAVQLANSQVKVEFESVKFTDNNSKLIVRVSVQNFSTEFPIKTTYGYDYPAEPNGDLNFYLAFDNIEIDEKIKITPSVITIKTIYDTWKQMPRPYYNLKPTGSDKAELWEIIFNNIDSKMGNLNLYVLSKTYNVGDVPGASEYKRKKTNEIVNERKFKFYDYSDFYYKEESLIKQKVESMVSSHIESVKNISPVSFTFKLSIDTLQQTKLEINCGDQKLKEKFEKVFLDYKLSPCYKYSFSVSASCEYRIEYSKGNRKVKVADNKIKDSSGIPNTVQKKVEQGYLENGKYRITYCEIITNGKQSTYSFQKVKYITIPPMYFIYGGAGVLGIVLATNKEILETFRSILRY